MAPFMQIFGTAAGAAEKLNKTIVRESRIDGTDHAAGQHLESVQGDIEFQDVTFTYPSRPDSQVLKGVSFRIPAHKHTAIVGQSGSGKSTVAALLARLYDPVEGCVRYAMIS
jgi:ATP-binding cassette, subfamily B (MDR/TAP), member 1